MVHVVAESHLTVVLLLAGHIDTVEGLLHEHNLFLLACQEHQHLGSEVTRGKGVLAIEGEGPEVGQIGVEHDEGYLLSVQYVGELARHIELGRHHYDAIGVLLEYGSILLAERCNVIAAIVFEGDIDVEASSTSCQYASLSCFGIRQKKSYLRVLASALAYILGS